jgi:hypothetical protein
MTSMARSQVIGSTPTLFGRFAVLAGFVALVLLSPLAVRDARAQSTEIDLPTPVRSHDVDGSITARDLGDARLTRYFYAFVAVPGDLVISVESTNLNGDVDLFTAGNLRPLGKISVYAEASRTRASKTIYFRRREDLILRIEARSPNDNPGIYHIRLDGAFEPSTAPQIAAEESESPTSGGEQIRTDRRTRRVSSVGARINEPAIDAPAETARPATTPSAPPVANTTTEPLEPASTTTRTTRNKGTRARMPRAPAPAPASTPPADRTPPQTSGATNAPAVEPPAGPRLIIETKDGMTFERYMSTVRRLTVENGQIVVLGTNGKVERHPMVNVLRMAIEP